MGRIKISQNILLGLIIGIIFTGCGTVCTNTMNAYVLGSYQKSYKPLDYDRCLQAVKEVGQYPIKK